MRHSITPRRPGAGGAEAGPYYPPRADTFLLKPFAAVAPRVRFLEVGTGSGEVALEAARRGARVVATDRNPFALRRLVERAQAERLEVAAVRTDLARGLGRFDRVVFNPPYLPTTPEQRDPDRWHNLALDGGPDGSGPTRRWVAELADHLRPAGEGFVVVSSLESAVSIEEIWAGWRARGGTVEIVASRDLPGERLEVARLTAGRLASTGPS